MPRAISARGGSACGVCGKRGATRTSEVVIPIRGCTALRSVKRLADALPIDTSVGHLAGWTPAPNVQEAGALTRRRVEVLTLAMRRLSGDPDNRVARDETEA